MNVYYIPALDTRGARRDSFIVAAPSVDVAVNKVSTTLRCERRGLRTGPAYQFYDGRKSASVIGRGVSADCVGCVFATHQHGNMLDSHEKSAMMATVKRCGRCRRNRRAKAERQVALAA